MSLVGLFVQNKGGMQSNPDIAPPSFRARESLEQKFPNNNAVVYTAYSDKPRVLPFPRAFEWGSEKNVSRSVVWERVC